jgi:hypothetical protein
MKTNLAVDVISRKIYFVRGKKILLDQDLAILYGVATKNLNKAVRRNLERFPEDFMFQLSRKEAEFLRFQIGTLKRGAHRKYLPLVFTEQGVAMLSSVLKSKKAARVNVAIMRAFVRLREMLLSNEELLRKMQNLEQTLTKHDKRFKKHGQEIRFAFRILQKLIEKPGRKMGFETGI